jgi:hypothetical protein
MVLNADQDEQPNAYYCLSVCIDFEDINLSVSIGRLTGRDVSERKNRQLMLDCWLACE